MGTKRFSQLSLMVTILAFTVSCTKSSGGALSQEERDEVLENNSVFDSNQTIASFHKPSDVASFNGENRPMVKTTANSCGEDTPPIDDNTDTPPDSGIPGEDPANDDLPVDDVLPPPSPICNDGFIAVGDSCVSLCTENQTFAQGQCYDNTTTCPINNGEGQQEWLANSYGSCQVTSCNEGFQNQNNNCVSQCTDEQVFSNGTCHPLIADCKVGNTDGTMTWNGNGYDQCNIEDRECPIDNGKGIARWLASQSKHDKCEVISCDNEHKEQHGKCELSCGANQVSSGKECVDVNRPCDIAGGSGKQWWSRRRGRYKRCLVTDCNNGFVKRGNSCVEDSWSPWENGEADPLIVDLGADTNIPAGITLSSQIDGILFDILGLNARPVAHDKKRISWTTNPRYQFLVRPDANGQVRGVDQMFGDNTMGPDGQFSREGFEALGKFDIDKNNRIDLDDPVFRELALWNDGNGNGVADLGELSDLRSLGIASVDLNYDPNFFEVDKYGNKTSYKSIVSFSDGRKTLIFDIWFRYLEPNGCPPATEPGGSEQAPPVDNNF